MNGRHENSEYYFKFVKYHLDKSESDDFHWHRGIEIIYVLSGEYMCTINNEKHKAHEGDILVVNSGVIHSLIALTDDCWDYVLKFNINMLNPFLKTDYTYIDHYIKAEDLKASGISNHLGYLFDKIYEETENKERYYLELSTAYVQEIWAILSRYFQSNEYIGAKKKSTINRFQNVLNYIDENYMNDIKLEDIAEKVHYSKYYLSKLFVQFTNMNFRQYINNLRIKKASILLKSSDLSITEIAFQCGYNSIASFNNNFLSIMSITPNKYRNQQQ